MSDDSLEKYRSRVNGAVEMAEEMIDDGLPKPDAIADACDGYPIYYSQILDVIRYSDTSPDEIDTVKAHNSENNWDVLTKIAYRLFRSDVRDKLLKRENERN